MLCISISINVDVRDFFLINIFNKKRLSTSWAKQQDLKYKDYKYTLNHLCKGFKIFILLSHILKAFITQKLRINILVIRV